MATATAKKKKKAVKGGKVQKPAKPHQTQLEALGNRVVVELIAHATMSEGGIVIPDAAQHRPNEARIVTVGPGKMLQNGDIVPIKLNVNDRVLIVKYGGSEIKLNGKDLLVLDADSEVLLRLL